MNHLKLAACLLFVAPLAVEAEEEPTITVSAELRARCLKVLRAGMKSQEFWPSIHAAEGLALAGQGDEVREFLGPKLVTEKDDQRRCGIIRELVRAGDCEKGPLMIEILAKDDTHGHVHAAESSFKVWVKGDGKLLRAATKSDNVKLELMAAAALARHGDKRAFKKLRKRLKDSDPEVNRIASWILARIGDDTDVPQIRKNVAASKDELTRAYHQHALAALRDKEGIAALIKNLSSKDAAVRTYAATFAGDARALGAKSELVRLLDDENIDVRVRSAQSLLVLSKPTASPVCMKKK